MRAPRSRPCPISSLRGVTVIAVFVGLLAMTRFFHADELRRLGAMRRRSAPVAATNRAPDSTEMAGEIVATDIGVPRVTSRRSPELVDAR